MPVCKERQRREQKTLLGRKKLSQTLKEETLRGKAKKNALFFLFLIAKAVNLV